MKRSKVYYAKFFAAVLAISLPWVMAKRSHSGPLPAGTSDYIEGTVTSAKGPEAGVWVIAETSDLPTKYAKVVVTDDRGRYALPQLAEAYYKVWVRCYGLVDSTPVSCKPGQTIDLKAVVAPDGKSAALVYPANYW